jgi:hypothetical protein
MYVVRWEPLMVSSNVFCDPYVFSLAGAMSSPPFQGPLSEVAQNTLLGLARQPVLPDTMRKKMPSALKSPGAS